MSLYVKPQQRAAQKTATQSPTTRSTPIFIIR